MDVTHIPAHAPPRKRVTYKYRHGQTTQNVLTICGFEMHFIYIYAGWEGSTHNTRVGWSTNRAHTFSNASARWKQLYNNIFLYIV